MKIKFTPAAEKDIKILNKKHRTVDINTIKKLISDILQNIDTSNRLNGIGKPEKLRHFQDDEVYSRRINEKDRLVYLIKDDEILIMSALGHYDD